MNLVVVGKLGDAEPVEPVVLVMVDEETEVLFQLLVDPFRLSIGLRVVRRGGVVLDAQELVKVRHEVRLKLGSSIVDDLGGNAVELEHVVTKQLGHAFSREGGVRGNRVHLLGEAVHNHADGVVAGGDRERSDEIEGDGVPGPGRNVVRLQGCLQQGPSWLRPLTRDTALNILSDVSAHARPVVVPGDELKGLAVTCMSGRGVVVVCVNDLPSQCFTPGNVKMLLERDNLVLLLPILVLFL